jgi:peptidoglycan/LPS O-acetylase OafA/YrhL
MTNLNNRLAGVDGLRAIAAMWVVLFHVHAFSHVHIGFIPGLDLFLRSGSTGVSLFLVLSGFCLYQPFAAGRQGRFRTGAFFWRRCRRLLPAYYTSLAIFLPLSVVIGSWVGYPRLEPLQVTWQAITHVTLTHPLFPNTFYGVNGAYWSLGLEWELYLTLPLLIVGIRRFGVVPTVSAAIGCNLVYRLLLALAVSRGAVPAHTLLSDAVLPNLLPGRWAEFALGMVAAELYASGRISKVVTPAGLALIPLAVLSIVAQPLPISHLVFGVLFTCLLLMVLAQDNPIAGVLSWPPVVAVGTMSYSLYLVHQPIVGGLAYLIRVDGGASPAMTFIAVLAALPLIFGVAALLFVTVEKRTLSARTSSVRRVHPVAQAVPKAS